MLLFPRMAWRNIVRNVRRTLITLVAIAFGLASVIVFFGFTDGFHAQWIENAVKVYSGHIQVYGAEYRDERNLNRSIKDVALVVDQSSRLASLEAMTTRIHLHGLASTAKNSSSAVIRVIDVDREASITALNRRMIKGEYLEPGKSKEIILGHKLAQRLNAELGDKVVLMVQAADGSLGAELFRLKGLFKLGAIDLDRFMAAISMADDQDLAVLGGAVTEAVLVIDRPENVIPAIEQLKQALSPADYEVITWYELLPQSREMIDLSNVFMYVILVIVLVVVSLGILNTMLMSIMERTREFGIMMALGTKPRQVVALVMLESVFLGLVGVAIGTLLGIGANKLIAIKGFDLSQWSGAMELVSSLDPVIYPDTNISNVVVAAILTFVTTVVVSGYPAWRAARMNPVEAIHFV